MANKRGIATYYAETEPSQRTKIHRFNNNCAPIHSKSTTLNRTIVAATSKLLDPDSGLYAADIYEEPPKTRIRGPRLATLRFTALGNLSIHHEE